MSRAARHHPEKQHVRAIARVIDYAPIFCHTAGHRLVEVQKRHPRLVTVLHGRHNGRPCIFAIVSDEGRNYVDRHTSRRRRMQPIEVLA